MLATSLSKRYIHENGKRARAGFRCQVTKDGCKRRFGVRNRGSLVYF